MSRFSVAHARTNFDVKQVVEKHSHSEKLVGPIITSGQLVGNSMNGPYVKLNRYATNRMLAGGEFDGASVQAISPHYGRFFKTLEIGEISQTS